MFFVAFYCWTWVSKYWLSWLAERHLFVRSIQSSKISVVYWRLSGAVIQRCFIKPLSYECLHTNTCLSDSFLKSYRPCNYIWPYIKKESLAQVFFLWNFSEQLLQKTVNDYFWTLRVDLEKKRLWNQKFIIEVIIKVLKKSVLVCNFY